ncbi:hypothetical protein VP01_5291g1 [Puccinia sorghi]|uniref:Uncharacterized protein n=1 Tax=Puccinia sorghi TaxID=27349 RepID=A0A0L6UL32_9BASI|nr:hypothetical protein VP01_5291g1 [Puccinia sorghi]
MAQRMSAWPWKELRLSKADTESAGAIKLVADITAPIIEVYGGNTESMRVKDPLDPTRSVRVNWQNLWVWARALQMGVKDVDLDKPPTSTSIIARRARLPSANNQMYTPSRVSSSGRIMPPRLIPDLDEDKNLESSLIMSPQTGSDMEDSAPDVGGALRSPKGPRIQNSKKDHWLARQAVTWS